MGQQVEKVITVNDFAEAFGSSIDEVIEYCGEIINKYDFRYRVCSQEEREKIIYGILKKCDENQYSVSGPHRKPDWEKGWGEILDDFHKSGHNVKSLTPKCIHGDRPLRYNGNYIVARSEDFELGYSLVFRNWLFKKYFVNYQNIYEFGCGTGRNLVQLASLYPDKSYLGLDWVPESKEIIANIAEKHNWKMEGFSFDFFNPDHSIKIAPNSLIHTSAALEQVGTAHDKFIDYLLEQKPSLCVNIECVEEFYDENLFDFVAYKYHMVRNYLKGFLTRLEELQNEGRVRILAAKRVGLGSLHHEVYSYIVWQIL